MGRFFQRRFGFADDRVLREAIGETVAPIAAEYDKITGALRQTNETNKSEELRLPTSGGHWVGRFETVETEQESDSYDECPSMVRTFI